MLPAKIMPIDFKRTQNIIRTVNGCVLCKKIAKYFIFFVSRNIPCLGPSIYLEVRKDNRYKLNVDTQFGKRS